MIMVLVSSCRCLGGAKKILEYLYVASYLLGEDASFDAGLFPNRRKRMRPLFLIFLAVALSGCAIFTSPKEQPVIEDRSSNWFNMEKVGVLSTTAERREVIFKFPGNKFSDYHRTSASLRRRCGIGGVLRAT